MKVSIVPAIHPTLLVDRRCAHCGKDILGFSRVLCLDPEMSFVKDQKIFVHIDCADAFAHKLVDSFRFLNIIER